MWRVRLNLSPENHQLLAAPAPAPADPGHWSPFAKAWRNYVKSIFKRGFMYTLSCRPSTFLYVSENKTLGGKEERNYEGEASGRKLVVSFFEAAGAEEDRVRPVDRESVALKIQLITVAEILAVCGVEVPPDPERPSSETELLLEARYEDLEIQRFPCTLDPDAPQVHTFALGDEVNAEVAFCEESKDLTKMALARLLQRNGKLNADETLQQA